MTDIGDARLREAYARAVAARGDASRAACPAPAALAGLARHEGAEDARIRLLDHVLTCPRCREEFELLRAIETAGGARPAAPARRTWAPYAAAALAASLLLAVLTDPIGRFSGADRDPVVRGADDVLLVAPAADAVVRRTGPLRAAWRRVPDARRYTLELLTPDGTVVLRETTTDTAVALAASRLPRDGAYRWWVRAAMPDGAERQSPVRRLRIRE